MCSFLQRSSAGFFENEKSGIYLRHVLYQQKGMNLNLPVSWCCTAVFLIILNIQTRICPFLNLQKTSLDVFCPSMRAVFCSSLEKDSFISSFTFPSLKSVGNTHNTVQDFSLFLHSP